MLIGKNTQPNMKYNLFIVKLINELSSNMKANNEIINETKESMHIQISIVIRNKTIFHSQNRGNLHKNMNIIVPDMIQIATMFNKFLKNH